MGSYMRLGNKEVNTKCSSEMIFDEIMAIKKDLLSNYPLDNPHAKSIIQEVDMQNESTGVWRIHREILAIAIIRLTAIKNDSEECKRCVENTEEYQSYESFSEHPEDVLNRSIQIYQDDLQHCIDYLTDVLCNMVISRKKRIKLTWS